MFHHVVGISTKRKLSIRPKTFRAMSTFGFLLPNIFLKRLYFIAISRVIFKIALKEIGIASVKAEIDVETIANKESYVHSYISSFVFRSLLD